MIWCNSIILYNCIGALIIIEEKRRQKGEKGLLVTQTSLETHKNKNKNQLTDKQKSDRMLNAKCNTYHGPLSQE